MPLLAVLLLQPLASNPDVRPIPLCGTVPSTPGGSWELRWRNAPKPTGSPAMVGGGVSACMQPLSPASVPHVTLVENGMLSGHLWFTEVDTDKES